MPTKSRHRAQLHARHRPATRGGAAPRSTSSTCAASRTATATGSATWPASGPACAYLAELGVDAIWFNPWYPSPMSDAGYDISDYREHRPGLRHAGRRGRADRRGARARHPDHHRRRAQPRLRPASVVHRGAGGRARVAGAGPVLVPARPRPGRRRCRRTTGSRSSAAPPGPGSPSRTARPASGTCTCSRREQPDFNWANAGRPARVRGRAAVLVRPRRRTASGSTRRALLTKDPALPDVGPDAPPGPGTRTPTATTCTTSTGPGGPSPTRTPAGC